MNAHASGHTLAPPLPPALLAALQEAGVQVVYGVVGYKTHAKMLLIVRSSCETLATKSRRTCSRRSSLLTSRAISSQ